MKSTVAADHVDLERQHRRFAAKIHDMASLDLIDIDHWQAFSSQSIDWLCKSLLAIDRRHQRLSLEDG